MNFRDYLTNKWIRIVLMVGFFLFIYQILYAIGIFFAIDSIILSMYMCWTGMIVLFGSLLPIQKYMFSVKEPMPVMTEVMAPAMAPVMTQPMAPVPS